MLYGSVFTLSATFSIMKQRGASQSRGGGEEEHQFVIVMPQALFSLNSAADFRRNGQEHLPNLQSLQTQPYSFVTSTLMAKKQKI